MSFVPTVGVKALRAVVGAAAAAGLDASAFAAEHGLSPEDLADPDLRFPHAAWQHLWDELARRTGDPGIGLYAAAGLPHGYWDAMDYIIASSDTVGDAFRRFERYFPVISTGVSHAYRVEGAWTRIVRVYAPGVVPSRPATEFALANVARRFRTLASTAWSSAYVTFSTEPSVDRAEYRRVLGCDARFKEREEAYVVPTDVLAVRMERPAPELCAVLERHAARIVAELPKETSLVARVRRALAVELRAGSPELARVAKSLGMSARTLQRRLAEEGTPYRQLVEATREDLARSYLADRAFGLGEVGLLVGFTDASAFYKAFRRWTGETPGAYRARVCQPG